MKGDEEFKYLSALKHGNSRSKLKKIRAPKSMLGLLKFAISSFFLSPNIPKFFVSLFLSFSLSVSLGHYLLLSPVLYYSLSLSLTLHFFSDISFI